MSIKTLELKLRKVKAFISNVDKQRVKEYSAYWTEIKPRTDLEYYQVWLFAFMSIHTSWRMNVAGYLAVKDLPLDCKWADLERIIKKSGVGLHVMRTRGIIEFRERYWRRPENWHPKKDEKLSDFRTRMAKELFGIGMAKTSFAFEMAYPIDCDVVCLDTHLLQLYGHPKQAPSYSNYTLMEWFWVKQCAEKGFPSPMVRHIYWDIKQSQPNTRYWSHVFERS